MPGGALAWAPLNASRIVISVGELSVMKVQSPLA